MAKRWFGPRPLESVFRHGSCGCCKCGGYYSAANVADFDGLFTRYPAYRDGLRLKLVIAGVPDAFNVALDTGYPIYLTEASGMSGYNGTWFFDIIRSQYGCIFNATDNHSFDVAYRMSDPDFDYDLGYTQRVTLGPSVFRLTPMLQVVSAYIEHFSPDYYDNVVLSGEAYGTYIHPMIGVAFEPTDGAYLLGNTLTPNLFTNETEGRSVGWDATRLTDVISGNLRFFLSQSLGDQDPMFPGFTDSAWTGTSTFWDTGTSDFKLAGTFTAEIERL